MVCKYWFEHVIKKCGNGLDPLRDEMVCRQHVGLFRRLVCTGYTAGVQGALLGGARAFWRMLLWRNKMPTSCMETILSQGIPIGIC